MRGANCDCPLAPRSGRARGPRPRSRGLSRPRADGPPPREARPPAGGLGRETWETQRHGCPWKRFVRRMAGTPGSSGCGMRRARRAQCVTLSDPQFPIMSPLEEDEDESSWTPNAEMTDALSPDEWSMRPLADEDEMYSPPRPPPDRGARHAWSSPPAGGGATPRAAPLTTRGGRVRPEREVLPRMCARDPRIRRTPTSADGASPMDDLPGRPPDTPATLPASRRRVRRDSRRAASVVATRAPRAITNRRRCALTLAFDDNSWRTDDVLSRAVNRLAVEPPTKRSRCREPLSESAPSDLAPMTAAAMDGTG